jgi:1,5-anhydro-D-fructose reductase (1,5-anhydro-D-mannitol-forming)
MISKLPPLPHAGTLGWGIVGTGSMAAETFLPHLRTLPPIDTRARYPAPNSLPLGVFSHREHRAQAFAQHWAVPHAFVNLADLLAQPAVQCIYVANHPRHHAHVVQAALAAGKHVLCEPPLALSADEAQQVAYHALNRGLILAVNFTRRGEPALVTLRDLLDDHTLGDLTSVQINHTGLLPTRRQSWRLRPGGGGVLLDRMAHSVDILRFLLHDDVTTVYTAAAPPILSNAVEPEATVEEDVVSILTLRDSSMLVQSHDSFLGGHTPTSVEIAGSRGTLLARHVWNDDAPGELWLHRHGQTTAIPLPAANPFAVALHRFTEAVRTQGAPLAGGPDAVAALAVIEAAQLSLARRQRIGVTQPLRILR